MPKSVYVQIAESVIRSTILNAKTDNEVVFDSNSDLHLKRACFVSIHNIDDTLRGCIGTIEPVSDNLLNEIKRNAVAACTRDPRFDPVKPEELKNLVITVDVLSLPEKVEDISSLDPVKYGVIISDKSRRKGVLLPDLPDVTTVNDQIRIVKRKAGIWTNGYEGLEIFRFTTKRYY